jgi:UrcA family protein
MKTFAIIAATSALSLSVLSVAAAGTDGAPSTTVRFADLDLTRVEGSAALYSRLTVAAKTVCHELDSGDSAHGILNPRLQERYQECIHQAIAGAAARINQPTFSAYVSTKMTLPANSTAITLAAK